MHCDWKGNQIQIRYTWPKAILIFFYPCLFCSPSSLLQAAATSFWAASFRMLSFSVLLWVSMLRTFRLGIEAQQIFCLKKEIVHSFAHTYVRSFKEHYKFSLLIFCSACHYTHYSTWGINRSKSCRMWFISLRNIICRLAWASGILWAGMIYARLIQIYTTKCLQLLDLHLWDKLSTNRQWSVLKQTLS